MIARLFHHPHYYSAALVSRLGVNTATFIWGAFVLFNPELMQRMFFTYQFMLALLPERVWATGAIVIASAGLYRIVRASPPLWAGSLSYGAQALFWLYLAFTTVFAEVPVAPASAAAITVQAVLALYAFIASPRKHHASPVSAQ